MAEWREKALAPRGAKLHDRLKQGTKELPPLQIGDHVMIQNQLGNKPKRWDKRGVVVQADPKTRQYKVMTFGSRRLTLRNRRFLRKYTPIHTPPGTPTGLQLGMRLGKGLVEKKPAQSMEEEAGRGPGSSTGPLQPQPDTEPAPVSPIPVRNQPQYCLPPAPEPAHQTECSQPAVYTEYSLPQYQAPMTPELDRQIVQQHHPHTIQPAPVSPPQVPVHTSVSPRVSARANKGKTSRYDDFVQQITTKVQQITNQVQQIANLYKLEDTGINNHQVWKSDTAYLQYMPSDRHQTPWVPANYHINHQNYEYGYLNNDVYYGDFRP